MNEKIELKDIAFENVDSVLSIAPNENQQRFCEPVSRTIATAYAGINEGCPGFLKAIYYHGIPVGIILIGRSPVGEDEPEIIQKYEYVYRIWNLVIDKKYQRKGIGKAALKLALEETKKYPQAGQSPVYLECHIENNAALSLYESIGFQNVNFVYKDDYCVLICFPSGC